MGNSSPTEAFRQNSAAKVTRPRRAYQKLQRGRETLFKKAFEHSIPLSAMLDEKVRSDFDFDLEHKKVAALCRAAGCQPHRHFPMPTYWPLTVQGHDHPLQIITSI